MRCTVGGAATTTSPPRPNEDAHQQQQQEPQQFASLRERHEKLVKVGSSARAAVYFVEIVALKQPLSRFANVRLREWRERHVKVT